MLTLFTEPSLSVAFNLYKDAKNIAKKVMGKKMLPYSGHYAVVRSVVTGLEEMKVDYNYNPRKLNQVGEHVHVLAGIDALKMAIKLKRKNKIKRLTAGPNIVISSTDNGGFIASEEIDLYTVNSEWTRDLYLLDNPKLKNRIDYWYAGIDLKAWNLNKEKTESKQSLNFLLYIKRPEYRLLEECKKSIEMDGHRWDEIVYGDYKLDEFKEKLQQADIVVYFVEQESQGIAMFEIWGANIPTWHWNPRYWQYKMKNYRSSSAPYLCEMTGRFFRDSSEFTNLLKYDIDINMYRPRDWVESNATDCKAAENFLNVIRYEYTR